MIIEISLMELRGLILILSCDPANRSSSMRHSGSLPMGFLAWIGKTSQLGGPSDFSRMANTAE
jgi:hypothetical protein